MSPDSGLERDTFEEGRIYTDYDELWLPSVSTVLGVREKAPALRNYLKNTSEEEKKKKKFYTQNRGTLIHWYLQEELEPGLEWTEDEQSSKECLKGTRVHNSTGLTGGQDTWDRFERDLEWAQETWHLIKRIFGIYEDNTLGIELFVKNTDVGYAGQFDLLYVDDGDVVLADLKTSKRVYDKHLIQCVAYKHAVNIAVDRMEVIRLNPDSQTWKVSRSDEWVESEADLWDEFVGLRDELQDETIQDLKERAQDG